MINRTTIHYGMEAADVPVPEPARGIIQHGSALCVSTKDKFAIANGICVLPLGWGLRRLPEPAAFTGTNLRLISDS